MQLQINTQPRRNPGLISYTEYNNAVFDSDCIYE